jgi:hypothetical protein
MCGGLGTILENGKSHGHLCQEVRHQRRIWDGRVWRIDVHMGCNAPSGEGGVKRAAGAE